MGLETNCYQMGTEHVVYQTSANFIQKKISMVTGFKVSSIAYKRVFYRTEHNAKLGPHRIQFERS